MTPRRLLAALLAALLTALATAGLLGASAVPTWAARPDRPAAPAHGWAVVPLGPGRYAVSWTSPARLPLTSDRPQVEGEGLSFGLTTIGADRRTVTAVVAAPAAPRPADLDVMLSGDRLDEPGDDVALDAAPVARAAAAPARSTLAVDPGVVGAFPIRSSDYTLPSVKLPGLPEPIEMVGHVVEPVPSAATGPRPLVLFLHGRHDVCYRPGKKFLRTETWPCRAPQREVPSQLGYVYIQDLLASQGYTTVSIRVNGVNYQDYRLADGGADARAAIVQRHLDYWTTIAAAHHTDLSRVVLVGHSRGGEGVDRASIEIPLTAPYRIAGQVLIAPTDFGSQTAPYVPTVTILPYCDGDVSDLEGQRFTDAGRDVLPDDDALKSSVLVMGADHNFFNSEWTPGISAAPSMDDWTGPKRRACGSRSAGRLGPGQQRAVGAAYVAGAVHLFADGDQAYLPMFDGSPVSVASAGSAVVYSSAIGGGRVLRRPGVDATRTLPDGAATSLCAGEADYRVRTGLCGSHVDAVTPNWNSSTEQAPSRRFFEMAWTAAGQSGGLAFDKPLDLSSGLLDLRTIVDDAYSSVGFDVRLTDTSGYSATLTPMGGPVLRSLLRGDFVTKLWAQEVRVDPAAAAGVDLAHVARVDLVATSDVGRVWVADLAATPAVLPAVPDLRAPTVSLGQLQTAEGDGGTFVAQVPFRVHGTLVGPARVTIDTTGLQPGGAQRFSLDLAPGQTAGAIAVPYDANSLDDLSPAITSVTGFAVSGVMTAQWIGELRVIDDDPTPKLTVSAVTPTVQEGSLAEFRVALAGPVDYPVGVNGQVVNVGRHRITVGDVDPAWLRTHAAGPHQHPGDRLQAFLFADIRRGATSALLTIPIRHDGLKEPAESVRLKIAVGNRIVVRTVYIAPSPGRVIPAAGNRQAGRSSASTMR